MQLRLILVILALAIPNAFTTSPDLVIEVFRHGARAPDFGNFDREKRWEGRLGELTPNGMHMHYNLGKALKERYPDLFAKYDPSKILIKSTDYNRTLMSAYSQLYGIFEENELLSENQEQKKINYKFIDQIISKVSEEFKSPHTPLLNLGAFHIDVVNRTENGVLSAKDNCQKSTNWTKETMLTQEVNDIFKNDLKEVVTHLMSKNLKFFKLSSLTYLSDIAVANKFENFPLPGQLDPNSQHYEDLKFALEWLITNKYEGFDIQKEFYGYRALEVIENYMEAVLNDSSSLNFIFLSGHDTSLLHFLSAMNIVTKECLLDNYRAKKSKQPLLHPNCIYPEYASNVIFELYKTPTPHVKFIYNGKTFNLCNKEDGTCTIGEFKEYIKKITKNFVLTKPKYDEECRANSTISI